MSRKLKLTELLKNDSFKKWVEAGRPANDSQWGQQTSSEEEQLLEEAGAMLKGIPFQAQRKTAEERQQSWKELSGRLSEQAPSRNTPALARWMRIAAACLFLVVSVLAFQWHLNQPEWIVVQTTFGETQTISLPDGSKVVLGANSELAYDPKMMKRDNRQLNVTGEAYFQVKRQLVAMPFIVSTNGIEVEVLGTTFNINARNAPAVVSLVEGSLRLRKKNIADPTKDVAQLLEPNQSAWFEEDIAQFVFAQENTNYWTSWINEEWSFGTATPLRVVVERIEDVFGVRCEVTDQSILERPLAGNVSVESPEILYQSLSVLLDLKFTKKGEILLIE